MARHGENIRKRGDGRWEGRYQVYSEKKGKKVYHSVYGRTYEETREKLNKKKSLLQAPLGAGGQMEAPFLAEKILFREAAREWLLEVKNTKKQSTYIKYSLIYKNYLEEPFGEVALPGFTCQLVNANIPKSLSESLQKSIYCVLNQVLKYASQRYFLPATPIPRPIFAARNKAVEVFNKAEQAKLYSICSRKRDIFKTAVILCLHTGLRIGELCALKWSDLDFGNRIITVDRTVQRIYAEGHRTKTVLLETKPKSQCSRREIPMTDAVCKLFAWFQDREEYVLGIGRPMEPRTMQYHFKKILREAGLPSRNFHILRHTFATNCVEGGVDVKSLSEILGHSDVQITLNRYVHPTMDTKRRHMDSLSAFYGQIHGHAG